MSYWPSIVQNVIVDTNNTSTSNINSGNTWSGSGTSTLGVGIIQINVSMSQDGIIYVDQSPDNSNWTLTNTYNYYSLSSTVVGFNVTALLSYVRVRVKNISLSTATNVFINTYLLPIGEPLPTSLDEDLNLKVAMKSAQDMYGWEMEHTPTGEMRTVHPVRLIGAAFQGTTIDTTFWTSTTANGGTNTQDHSQMAMNSGTASNGSAIIQTTRIARFAPGAANRFRAIISFSDTGKINNTKKWGGFDGNNGAYFKLVGTSLYVCTMATNGTETNAIISTSWSNNRTLPDITLSNVYEIYWIAHKIYFAINDKLMHIINASVYWSDTLSIPCRCENVNSGNTTATTMTVWTCMIHRMGEADTRPAWRYIHGALSATQLKFGVGILKRVALNQNSNGNTITLYDTNSVGSLTNTIAAINTVANSVPGMLEFDLNFYNGLVVVTTGANTDCTIVFE